MFKINANPTIDATLEIIGQGRKQQLAITFRHMTADAYSELLGKIGNSDIDAATAIMQLVEKWDADSDLSIESIKQLQQQQPGADWAIISGFSEALKVERKGN